MALEQAAQGDCGLIFSGDEYSRPAWMPTCAACCREPALAGELDLISGGPFWPYNSVILCNREFLPYVYGSILRDSVFSLFHST